MGDWIPLMDYAMKTGVSLSTLRRHIKANKVQYRVENGRYLLFVEGLDNRLSMTALAPTPVPTPVRAPTAVVNGLTASSKRASEPAFAGSLSQSDDYLVNQLQLKLKKAQEEIAELKTLIAFYEETLSSGKTAMNRFDG